MRDKDLDVSVRCGFGHVETCSYADIVSGAFDFYVSDKLF